MTGLVKLITTYRNAFWNARRLFLQSFISKVDPYPLKNKDTSQLHRRRTFEEPHLKKLSVSQKVLSVTKEGSLDNKRYEIDSSIEPFDWMVFEKPTIIILWHRCEEPCKHLDISFLTHIAPNQTFASKHDCCHSGMHQILVLSKRQRLCNVVVVHVLYIYFWRFEYMLI